MRLWLFGVEDNIANASGQGRVIPPIPLSPHAALL